MFRVEKNFIFLGTTKNSSIELSPLVEKSPLTPLSNNTRAELRRKYGMTISDSDQISLLETFNGTLPHKISIELPTRTLSEKTSNAAMSKNKKWHKICFFFKTLILISYHFLEIF